MDEELSGLVARARPDVGGFARDVATMRQTIEAELGEGGDKAAARIEQSLGRALRSGRFGFDDLKRTAVGALAEIAAAALKIDVGGGGSGLTSLLGAALPSLAPRAIGGPVSGGRPYLVGERGPELFVPGSGGHIQSSLAPQGSGRPVNVTVNVATPRDAGAPFMAQTGRQVARSVRRALEAAR